MAAIDELCDTNVVRHRSNGEEIRGIENYKQSMSAMFNRYPDAHMTIDDMVAEGDKIAIRYTWTGTHKATNKKVTGWQIDIAHIVDGKRVEIWARARVYARLKEFGIRTQEAILRLGERTPKIPVGKINNTMYGPLKSAQTDPDVVLLICDPDQAMKLAEASGREDGAAPHALLNMPCCATVSSIYLSGKPAVTLACHGSRKHVPIKTERLLFGIPGKQLATFLKNLERVIEGRRRLEESKK